MALATLALVLLAAGSGKPKAYLTYPMPPHVKPADPMHVNPAYEVPEFPERYAWRVTGKIQGKPVFSKTVPVYAFDAFGGGRPTKIGEVPVGTEIKLEAFRNVGRVLYYALTLPGTKTVAYVSGLVVEPVAYTPPVQ